jgi:Flp pilus assembly protein TadG
MTRSALIDFAKARGGNVAVEFALVFPMFLMLVFGTIEYGRLLWTMQALQETANAGARCMALTQSACSSGSSYSATSTQSYITAVAQGWGLSLPSANMTLNNSATCGGNSGFSQVTLTTTFVSVVPKIVLLAAGGTSLRATACYPNSP